MSAVVLGIGASHGTMMNTHWDQARYPDRAQRFLDGLREANEILIAARPDVVIIIGSNHFRGFYLDLAPAFTIGLEDCSAMGEAGTPSGPQKVDQKLARHIVESLLQECFDVAFSTRLEIDHGISHAIQYLLTGFNVPIVPIVINVFAPPLPRLQRCLQFGKALRRAIDAFPERRRVAVIGSGGLSHQLPWPDWRSPQNADEEFLVEAWRSGRQRWREFEVRRREIVVKASLQNRVMINGAFDSRFLNLLEQGRLESLFEASEAAIESQIGNGGQEIRTWLAMAAALEHRPGRTIAYEEIPDWLTGMGVAVIDGCAED